jgi:hypothetical protein
MVELIGGVLARMDPPVKNDNPARMTYSWIVARFLNPLDVETEEEEVSSTLGRTCSMLFRELYMES